jgi:hypothetical protein
MGGGPYDRDDTDSVPRYRSLQTGPVNGAGLFLKRDPQSERNRRVRHLGHPDIAGRVHVVRLGDVVGTQRVARPGAMASMCMGRPPTVTQKSGPGFGADTSRLASRSVAPK